MLIFPNKRKHGGIYNILFIVSMISLISYMKISLNSLLLITKSKNVPVSSRIKSFYSFIAIFCCKSASDIFFSFSKSKNEDLK